MSSGDPEAAPSPQTDPIATPSPQPPRQPTNKTAWVVLAILLAMLIAGGAVCGGAYFLAVRWAEDTMAQDVRQYLADDPIVHEEIGDVDQMQMSLGGSMVLGDDRTLVYDVQGEHGSGKLTVYTIIHDDGDEEILLVVLLTDDGRELTL